MTRYVYAPWDGSQDTCLAHPEAFFDALMHNLLRYGDLDWALRDLLRRGYQGADGTQAVAGFDELLQYLEEQKRQLLRRYAADSFQLSEPQVQDFQQQITTAVTHVPDTALHEQAQAVCQTLAGRCHQPSGQPSVESGGETEVAQRLQQDLAAIQVFEPGDGTAPTGQEIAATLTSIADYLDRVQAVERQLDTFPFTGSEALGVAEAERLLRALTHLDTLRKRAQWGDGTLADLLGEALQPLLSAEMRQQIQPLQQIEALLEQAGLLRQTAEGLKLTPKGARRIGAKALQDILQGLQRRWSGQHAAVHRGQAGQRTGETQPYVFGDPLALHLARTLGNAVARQPQIPVQLHARDFEVFQTEPLTQSATVIMLDMSHSMELFGCNRFAAAKKVALALAHLVQVRFPHDTLHIVAFGDTARELHLHDLPYVAVGREHTNTQEGLRLARTLLARQQTAHKQILLITDGRPTAARINGQLHLHTWGLHPAILEETYKEARRCRQQRMTLNTFMIADDEPLVQFVKQLTAVSRGRAFYTAPDRLGEYIIEDYIGRNGRGF